MPMIIIFFRWSHTDIRRLFRAAYWRGFAIRAVYNQFFATNPLIFCFFSEVFCERKLWALKKCLPQMHKWFYLKISISFLPVTRHKLEFGAWLFLIYYVRWARICNPCHVQTFFRQQSTNFFLKFFVNEYFGLLWNFCHRCTEDFI